MDIVEDKPLTRIGADSQEQLVLQNTVGLARDLSNKNFDYLLKNLSNLPDPVGLLADYKFVDIKSSAKVVHQFSMGRSPSEGIRSFAEENKHDLVVVLVTIFKVLLFRYSQQNDIVVSASEYFEGSQQDRLPRLLAVRNGISGNLRFKEILAQVQKSYSEAQNRQVVCLKDIATELPLSNENLSSIFQFVLSLEQAGYEFEAPAIANDGSEYTDFNLKFVLDGSSIHGLLEYSPRKFKTSTVERFTEHFINVAKCLIENPDILLDDIEYVGDIERDVILRDFAQGKAVSVEPVCIHQLIFDSESILMEKSAVLYEDDGLSYKKLHEKSYALALYLQSLGIKPNDLVGIYIDRSLDMLVAILGILRAGAAYIPLDPTHPNERIRYILEDSNTSIILTQAKHEGAQVIDSINHVVRLDSQWDEIEAKVSELVIKGTKLDTTVSASDLAYVMYTSGSTGKPKGVMQEHGSVVNFLRSMLKEPGLDSNDRLLAITTYCFDISVLELFLPLVAKAQVCIAGSRDLHDGEKLKQLITRYNPTALQATPATWKMLQYAGYTPYAGFKILSGGEALSEELHDYFLSAGANAWNMFGPTETTVWSTIQRISDGDGIGRPIDNTQIYILDQNLRPQGIGVVGELHIAGAGLARGYLNRTQLTRERFITNPFKPETAMYRTGDLARWSEDGSLQFLGRIDTQVKMRGFRIELGEIEECMRLLNEVDDAVVVVQGEGELRHLVGFYLANEVVREPVDALVEQHLAKRLPPYMVPTVYERLASIPLNTNGKVDRIRLQSQRVEAPASSKYLAPRDKVEEGLVGIWSEVLDIKFEKIGVHDNFFDLGGNSLLAVKFIGMTNAIFERELPVAILFKESTIAEIAAIIKSNKQVDFETLVAIQSRGNNVPIFVVPGAGGNVLSLLPLAKALGNDQPLYGLQAIGLDGKVAPLEKIEEIAKVNIDEIQKVEPTGPYRLIGYSNGGITAFEMARRLSNDGFEVESLILFDSFIPSLMRDMMGVDQANMMYEVCTTVATLFDVELNLDIKSLENIPENQLVKHAAAIMAEHGLEMPEDQFHTLFGVFAANQQAVHRFEPTPIEKSLNISLFCTDEEKSYIPNAPHDYGWSSYVADPVRIFKIRGDHFSMLDQENVGDLVDKLMGCLSLDACVSG